MEIAAIEKVGAGVSEALPARPKSQSHATQSFGKLMEEMVGKVSDLQTSADRSIQDLATGQSKGLHEVMIAVEKASISFQLLSQVRNKAVEAYQEIMRMSV